MPIDATHPEATCEDCHGPNVVWHAPSPIWNSVVRDHNDGCDIMLCPRCFALRAAAVGLDLSWQLRPDPILHPETERYRVLLESESGHCCFKATVLDTSRPVMIRGEHYSGKNGPEYESVCESFSEDDARLICGALNANAEETVTIPTGELIAYLDHIRGLQPTPPIRIPSMWLAGYCQGGRATVAQAIAHWLEQERLAHAHPDAERLATPPASPTALPTP